MKFTFPILLALVTSTMAEERVFEAFEGEDFGTWAVTGEAFGKGPSAGGPGTLAGQAQAWAGASFACSFHGGDGAKGSLTSPEFTIGKRFIHFLVGGGTSPGQTAVQLLVEGEVAAESVGDGDPLFRPASWFVGGLQGKAARIRILDARDGAAGYIMADHFVFADAEAVSFPKPLAPQPPADPELVPTDAIPGMTIPAGTEVIVFADFDRHQLMSPSALDLDEQGNVLVTEVHRLQQGILDNRRHRYWILEDNAATSVADRRAMLERWSDKVSEDYMTAKSDLVRFLSDTDGDGVADVSKVYSDGYNGLLDGTASGILAFEGTTYLANIPHIWTLRDTDGDGVAEEKASLFEGFGTRVSYSGHDLNGFKLGPDGRIWCTIGDRAMRVTSKEGREFYVPDSGAVMRFDPDGSNFEVLHTGLRNPKELAFDKWGNAVTMDNNSDQGDEARLVHVIDGADSGWRVGHQNLGSFYKVVGYDQPPINQWMAEEQWKPRNDLQPAFLLPPLANFTNGPAGLAYQPGTGLAVDCEDAFLVCDYKGTGPRSGIWAFGVTPDGAGLAVEHPRKWQWGTAVTDLEFGFDGKLYVTDFIGGWVSANQGRLYTISDPQLAGDPLVAQVASLVREGLSGRDPADLFPLLGHPDQRIRLRATLALSRKPEGLPLFRLATEQEENRLKRLHGTWGLWMLARRESSAEATAALVSLLGDADAEVRAQAARALGEAPLGDPGPLGIALRDSSPKVRAFAALSLGRLGATERFNDLVALLAENNDRDLTLRHAGVMGLVGTGTPAQLTALAKNPSPAVRLGAVLALRRIAHPDIVAFLFDEVPAIRDEVIRAVHDLPIEPARPAVAALLDDYAPGRDGRPVTRMILRRLVHSAFRSGTPESVAALLKFAANPEATPEERLEALRLLAIWEAPPVVDQSTGQHLPLPPREFATVRSAFEEHLPPLLEAEGEVLTAAIGLAGHYGVAVDKLDNTLLFSMARNAESDQSTRIRAVELLATRGAPGLPELLAELLASDQPMLAERALELLAERSPEKAIAPIREVLATGSDERKQHAWSLLATLPVPEAALEITRALASLQGSTQYPGYALELVEAAEAREEPEVRDALTAFRTSLPPDDPLGEFRLALRGGDPERGAELFQSHPSAQCVRCHKMEGGPSAGGEAGPNLADIGARHDAEYILRSLVDPNADIAPGYALTSITFHNGTGIGGVLMAETDTTLDLQSGTDLLRIQKADIAEQTEPVSSMFATGELLTKREMRDLVAWLVTRTAEVGTSTTDAPEPELLDPATLLPDEPDPEPAEVAAIDPAILKMGQQSYAVCQGCHGPDGRGIPNVGPPLAGSEWVTGPVENLVRIQLRGLTGPITVAGTDYSFAAPMPAQSFQTDEQIAAVLTYIRNSWGNEAPLVTPDMVAAHRGEVGQPMLTVADLIPPPTPEPATATPTAGSSKPRSIFDQQQDSGGWPWWAWALIAFWIAVCIVPLVKQFRKDGDEEEE